MAVVVLRARIIRVHDLHTSCKVHVRSCGTMIFHSWITLHNSSRRGSGLSHRPPKRPPEGAYLENSCEKILESPRTWNPSIGEGENHARHSMNIFVLGLLVKDYSQIRLPSKARALDEDTIRRTCEKILKTFSKLESSSIGEGKNDGSRDEEDQIDRTTRRPCLIAFDFNDE
ncbi:hypothetical protein WN48_07480 [Eufriesea mexicana]|uniref:Uncharacterized protein n=1 Tax=Eufriesea mexicana TaxID=516756 RepID=A0A310SX25_9HYME|nr:hypothetical protein WN48_07480 [Eufriesea mexicana]